MLVLSRKNLQSVVIGETIRITVMRVKGEVVKLGIRAPSEVPVHRQEVYEEIQRCNQESLTSCRSAVPRMPRSQQKNKNKTRLAAAPSAGSHNKQSTEQTV